MITQTISALPKGTNFSRYVQALCLAKGNFREAADIARRTWLDSPSVYLDLELVTKAPIDSMSTSTVSALVGYGTTGEIVQLTRPLSIIGALESRMRRVPLQVKVPVETSTFGGTWIPEGTAIAVMGAAYQSGALDPFKRGVATVLSMELMRSSSPDAELTIRNSIVAAVAKDLDGEFLNPTLGLLAGERPAAVTFGGLFFTSTGSTSAQIESDLTGMMNVLGSWTSPTWIVPSRLARLLWKFGAPGMGPNIMGIPAVLSDNCGNRIVLLDAADILYADGGAEVSVSGQASMVLTTTPASSPMATSLVSLWQNDLVSVRVIRFVSWLRSHSNSVVTMSIAY